jgi:hypothetical protein
VVGCSWSVRAKAEERLWVAFVGGHRDVRAIPPPQELDTCRTSLMDGLSSTKQQRQIATSHFLVATILPPLISCLSAYRNRTLCTTSRKRRLDLIREVEKVNMTELVVITLAQPEKMNEQRMRSALHTLESFDRDQACVIMIKICSIPESTSSATVSSHV